MSLLIVPLLYPDRAELLNFSEPIPVCGQSGSYRAVVRIPLGGVSLHLSQVGQKPHTYRTGLGSAWYSPKSFIKGDDRHVDVSLAFGNGVLRLKLSALGV